MKTFVLGLPPLEYELEDDLEDDLDVDENFIDNGKKITEILFVILCCLSFIGIYIVFFFLYTKPFVIDPCINGFTNSSCVNEYICDNDNNCGYISLCKENKCNSPATWFGILFILTLIPSLLLLFILACLCNGLMNFIRFILISN